jgi:thiamine biosynthesis lipoprotein
MLKTEFRAMGCAMAVLLDCETPQAVRAIRQVPDWFEEWEQAFSRFRPDSELNDLNAASGIPFAASPDLWDVVQAALRAARWTDGLVVPTVRNSLERAGYDRSFDLLHTNRSGRQAPTASIDPSGRLDGLSEWRNIRLNENQFTITLPPGVRLDLGGIAKGWSAWQAMLRLEEFGPALVDAGGDIAVSGLQASGLPWCIDVADPLQVQERLDQLALDRCGVATSGIDYRRWLQDGAWKHHIIDPRTGEPAQTNLLSVTVIAPDLFQAEAAAKAALILGSQAGQAWLEDQPQLNGLLALPDGRLQYTSDIQPYLWS